MSSIDRTKTIIDQIKSNNSRTRLIKKQLPEIIKLSRDDFDQTTYLTFLKSCIKHYSAHSVYYSSEPLSYDSQGFFNWLQTDSLFVVKSGLRLLGFFVIRESPTVSDSHLSFSFFLHPAVCKLNAVTLSLTAFVCTCLYADEISNSSSVSSFFNHNLLFSDLLKFFETKVTPIQKNLYFLSSSFSSGSVKSTFVKYFEEKGIEAFIKELL